MSDNRAWKTAKWIAAALAVSVTLAASTQTSYGQEDELAKDVNVAKSLSKAFHRAADIVLPTVVQITTRARPEPGGPRGQQVFGVGSGVIIDPNGAILTNNHVVAGAGTVVVQLSDGREFISTDIKTDVRTDLAIVRIEGAGTLPAAKIGDSDALEIGDWVIAVGSPFGLAQTVSAGIISGEGRGIEQVKRATFLQTDAAINPGNSGGPLVNLDGEVVGINTAIASESGTYNGIGFAVPSNQAKWVLDQLISRGSVVRSYLGVQVNPVTQELARRLGIPPQRGVIVAQVFPNTPAAEAGLVPGDLIVDVAGKLVNSPNELTSAVEKLEPGSKQQLALRRDGRSIDLPVVVRQMPEDFDAVRREQSPTRPSPDQPAVPLTVNDLGIKVEDLNADTIEKYGYSGAATSGVIVSEVTKGNLADLAGIKPGMVIVNVGKKGVTSTAELEDALKEESSDQGVLLLVSEARGNRFIVVRRQ